MTAALVGEQKKSGSSVLLVQKEKQSCKFCKWTFQRVLADPSAISLEAFVSRQNLILVRVRAVQKTVCCPLCDKHSSSSHSHYIRHITDLPWVAWQGLERLSGH